MCNVDPIGGGVRRGGGLVREELAAFSWLARNTVAKSFRLSWKKLRA